MNISQISGVKVLLFSAFLFLLTGITLTSCSEKDTICECIEIGDQLNKKSSKALTHTPSETEIAEIKRLRKEKSKKCAEFQKMSGSEMLERKASCN